MQYQQTDETQKTYREHYGKDEAGQVVRIFEELSHRENILVLSVGSRCKVINKMLPDRGLENTMITGDHLNEKYKIGAVQARYREDGHWYHPLEKFPGVLFDANGYVLFKTVLDYINCTGVKKGPDPNHIHVDGGIASLPFYVQLDPPPHDTGL